MNAENNVSHSPRRSPGSLVRHCLLGFQKLLNVRKLRGPVFLTFRKDKDVKVKRQSLPFEKTKGAGEARNLNDKTMHGRRMKDFSKVSLEARYAATFVPKVTA